MLSPPRIALKPLHPPARPFPPHLTPICQAVIHFKWSTWASRLLGFELSLYAVWLLSFITFSLLFESEDPELTLLQLLATPTGCVAVVCDAVGLLAMLPFLYMEVGRVTGVAGVGSM